MPPKILTQISPKLAFMISTIVIAIMGVTMIGFGWVPHLSLILAICVLLAIGLFKGLSFNDMQEQMASGVMSGIGAIYLVLLYWFDGCRLDDVWRHTDTHVFWF